MLTRTNEWFRRIHWPQSGRAALGFGLELWDTAPKEYEGYEQLRARVTALGRRMTPREYAAELSADLLSDVLVAVGGVEQARADFFFEEKAVIDGSPRAGSFGLARAPAFVEGD